MASKVLIDMPNFCPMRVSAADYHALPALSSSFLKTANSEGWYVAARRESTDRSSRDLVIGSAVHSVIEGDFADRYRAAPAEFRTANSAKFDAFAGECEQAGKIALTLDEFELVRACGEAIKAKLDTWCYGRRRYIEGTLTWDEPTDYGPVPCKCRPDVLQVWSPTAVRYIELKTSRSNGPRAWKSDVWKYGYWIQEAHYEAGILANGAEEVSTVFLVVRKAPPVCVRVYETDPLQKLVAHRMWRDLVTEYARRSAQGDWDDDSLMSPTRVDLGLRQQDDLEEVEDE